MKKKAQFLPFKELLLTSTFPNQGFTMLEVLAALMISFAFLMGALNGITMAVWMQVKAERQAQANYWIQQDLENIRSQAVLPETDAIYTSPSGGVTACTPSTSSTPNTCCPQTTPTYNAGFARRLEAKVDATTPVNRTIMGKSYTMTRNTSGTDPNPQILTINYTIGETSDNTRTLANLYTEIIPAPAMACP